MKRYKISCILLAGSVLMAGCAPPTEQQTSGIDQQTMRTTGIVYPGPPGIFLDPGPKTRSLPPPGFELRKVVDRGIELTKRSEGFRSSTYNDPAGYCTVGYGHLIKRDPCDGSEPEEFMAGITEDRGTEILRDDMGIAESAVIELVNIDLTDGQYAALCDFTFNVGYGNFERSTLRKVVNNREFHRVPSELRRWVFAGGGRLPGLEIRREREIQLFFEGMPIPRARMVEDSTLIDIRFGE
jgi:GH24 family phage-related lysozyme (muramidase)